MAALNGLRVVELGTWVAVPATGLILADWGAEVIKVEAPQGGDPLRSLVRTGFLAEEPDVNPVFQLENSGKRSVTVDLRDVEQRHALHHLLATTDVLVTNLRAPSLERHGLTWAGLRERYPRLVYARLSGYGHVGEESDRPAYDYSAFWGRSGLLDSMRPGDALATPRPGVGDHAAALALCSGILAALYQRDRTGRGQAVDVSLYRTGVWLNGMETQMQHIFGYVPGAGSDQAPNPLFSAYRTADKRWLYLMLGQPERDWAYLCAALGRQDLLDDASFATHAARFRNTGKLRRLLEDMFLERDLAEWATVLDEHGIVWGPVRTVSETVRDRQLRVSGGFRQVATAEPIEVVAPPIELSESHTPSPALGAPALGEYNEIILGRGTAHQEETTMFPYPTSQPVLQKVGSESQDRSWAYTERDALLYNMSVGAGPQEPRLVSETDPGGLLVVPSFGVLPGIAALEWLSSVLPIASEGALLGEQELRLAGPIPPAATLKTKFELSGIYDKGANALAVVKATSTDDGTLLCENVFRVFLKGLGGFGGERGPQSLLGSWPDETVDEEQNLVASASVPLLYRLNGDWHPVHVDPKVARAEGHPRPPLHGMYLLGEVCRREWARDPAEGRPLSAAIRYLGPAYPEENLVVRYRRLGNKSFVEIVAGERDAGVCRIRITHAQDPDTG